MAAFCSQPFTCRPPAMNAEVHFERRRLAKRIPKRERSSDLHREFAFRVGCRKTDIQLARRLEPGAHQCDCGSQITKHELNALVDDSEAQATELEFAASDGKETQRSQQGLQPIAARPRATARQRWQTHRDRRHVHWLRAVDDARLGQRSPELDRLQVHGRSLVLGCRPAIAPMRGLESRPRGLAGVCCGKADYDAQ